ncbi:hypothetical protein [Streptomyces europaeiscabiei]|uniref:hypothetical protein n=1 Tax=Streptomyces europaeiscabiei TaxID=146819 RepID=UPI002E2D32DA|nr:hypothetical protein [Streptomyces europaeiscabiei]
MAAGTLYTLTRLAAVPREVTPGLPPVMEIAGVDQVLIDWSSTRRQHIEQALEGITNTYVPQVPASRATSTPFSSTSTA